MLYKKVTYTLLSLMALVCACSSDNTEENKDDHPNTIAMPVTLAIPASDVQETRAGDPGTYEQFKLPKYAYIYIVCKDQDDKDVVVTSTPTLDDSKWKKMTSSEAGIAGNDSVYQYDSGITVYLPIGRKSTGQVYAAVSTVPLDGLPTGNSGYTEVRAETRVQDYKFTLNNDVKAELANVYSTPYNYRPDGVNYYGTITNLDDLQPKASIVLYHVAAKLDLTWNVDPSIQSTTAIKTMTLSLPDASQCYIFRPLDTAPDTENGSPKTYTKDIAINIGNQWYGRAYTYVIPMTGTDNTYIFTANIQTTSTSTPTRSESINAGVILPTQPFTPWIRGNIAIR